MTRLAISESRLCADLETLARWGRGEDGAITRLALGEADAAARAWVRDRMRALGMDVWADEVGNLYGRRRGRAADSQLPFVLTGSHLDSVPGGGRFDGPFGIVGALEVVRAWNDAGIETERDLCVVVFVGEEGSRFRKGTLGSAAASGALASADVRALTDAAGIRFSDALRAYGGDPACDRPARLRDGSVWAFVEMHIEQGGVLETRGIPIGVVDAVAGLRQFSVTLRGESNHAGATPMGLRRDALAAAAELMTALEFAATSIGGGAVATVGKLDLPAGAAFNIIPGAVDLGVDMRAAREELLDELEEQLRATCARSAEKRRVDWTVTARQKVRGGPMHARVIDALACASDRAGLSHLRMPSGAIHDALLMSSFCPSGMLFVPSQGGKSHCREEATAPADLAQGTLVLAHALAALAAAS